MLYIRLTIISLILASTQIAAAKKIPCYKQIKEEAKRQFSKATGLSMGRIGAGSEKETLSVSGNSGEIKAKAWAVHNGYSYSEATYLLAFSPETCAITTKQVGEVETEPFGACLVSNFNAHQFCLHTISNQCTSMSFDNGQSFGAFLGGPCGPF